MLAYYSFALNAVFPSPPYHAVSKDLFTILFEASDATCFSTAELPGQIPLGIKRLHQFLFSSSPHSVASQASPGFLRK